MKEVQGKKKVDYKAIVKMILKVLLVLLVGGAGLVVLIFFGLLILDFLTPDHINYE
ncbi:MAG: hypothetical protein ACI35R_00475 [Bacillus sp. (in: firmicutes)]